MTETAERGAEAYRQAYKYVEAGGLYRTPWGRRRAAMRYLTLNASPPLSAAEQEAAADAMRRMRSMTRRDLVILAVVVLIFAGAIALAHTPAGSWRLP
jgi:hypothetical protein